MAQTINADDGVISGSAGLKSSSDGTAILSLQTKGTTALTVDGSQNVGLGVTPSAWDSGKAIEVNQLGTAFWGNGVNNLWITSNAYYNGGNFKYGTGGGNLAGAYQMVVGQHRWYLGPAGTNAGDTISFTQAMTLDSAGSLGIGVTSPGARLHVEQNTGSAIFRVKRTANDIFDIYQGSSVTYLDSTPAGGVLAFATAGTERARITSGGELVINGTSVLSSSRTTSYSAGNCHFATRNTSATAGQYWRYEVDASNDLYIVNHNTAGVYIANGGTSWSAVSDERLKTNLAPIENAVEKVSNLRAVTGRYKTDEESVSRAFLIAQDVQAVLPEAVNIKNDDIGTLGLAYTETIPLLVAAIKEQQAMIKALEAKVAALESK